MTKKTKIEWCDYTFNPWVGCTKISPACENCYAEKIADRFSLAQWGNKGLRRKTSQQTWQQVKSLNKRHADKKTKTTIFCGSMCDIFDNAVASAWRAELINLIASTPNLTWLLLTKRIGNAIGMLNNACQENGIGTWNDAVCNNLFENVCLGATICNQQEADRDIDKLCETPACRRFLSIEPLLGPVNLELGQPTSVLPSSRQQFTERVDLIHWVIVGGESGLHARPTNPKWVRSLRDQCAVEGTSFFFKQWGEWAPGRVDSVKKHTFADGQTVYRVGKKKAGANLDGKIIQEHFYENSIF